MSIHYPLPLEGDSTLGWLYSDRQLLIPLKVDITYSGCRLVDSFCWDCFSTLTPYEFAVKTCHDMNLPEGFKWKFTIQIQEQIDAFMTLIVALQYRTTELDAKIKKAFSAPLQISIGIRYNTLDCMYYYCTMFSTVSAHPFSIVIVYI
jgi:SNF5 / SMARCB1 / INI1